MSPVSEFEHYLQRNLTRNEWSIIAPLEQMRLQDYSEAHPPHSVSE